MVAPVVTELASHQCGQVSIPAGYHVWVEFVVASGLAPRVFTLAGIPVFSPPEKSAFLANYSSIRIEDPNENQLQFIRTYFIHIPLNISAISYET